MTDENTEVKTTKPKKGRPKEAKPPDLTTKTLIDWPQVEESLVKKFMETSWTVERHRANPAHTVGVVISTLIPEVLKLLR